MALCRCHMPVLGSTARYRYGDGLDRTAVMIFTANIEIRPFPKPRAGFLLGSRLDMTRTQRL